MPDGPISMKGIFIKILFSALITALITAVPLVLGSQTFPYSTITVSTSRPLAFDHTDATRIAAALGDTDSTALIATPWQADSIRYSAAG